MFNLSIYECKHFLGICQGCFRSHQGHVTVAQNGELAAFIWPSCERKASAQVGRAKPGMPGGLLSSALLFHGVLCENAVCHAVSRFARLSRMSCFRSPSHNALGTSAEK